MVAFATVSCRSNKEAQQPVKISQGPYHGWQNSFTLDNGVVQTVVVPAVGRVMQFRFTGEQDGPFWENRELDGKLPDAKSSEWGNFGGDKTWPAPQADWPKVTPRGWPPPIAFDAMPVEVRLSRDMVKLISPVDPHYGIKTERRISLVPGKPVMRITTRYDKVEGVPRKVGVWVITQCQSPEAVFAPVPDTTPYVEGFNRQSAELPLDLQVKDGLISLKRHPKTSHKIGNDASALLWVGKRVSLLVESPRQPGLEYPDQGSSAEIYTNPDPNAYVELELLGPLSELSIGQSITHTIEYTLSRRTEKSAEAEAWKLLRKHLTGK